MATEEALGSILKKQEDSSREVFLRLAALGQLEIEDCHFSEDLYRYFLNVRRLISSLDDLKVSFETEPASVYVLGEATSHPG